MAIATCELIGDQAVLNAKIRALEEEFEFLTEVTRELPWCQKYWWEADKLKLHDWIQLDAWFRSRSLDLPPLGECMAPCIDMVNHSNEPNSYYESTLEGGIALLLRPHVELEPNSEITITYGETKSHAEMLYSYGFIDQESKILSLTIFLQPLDDDPLGKAKLATYPGPPTLQLYCEDGRFEWKCSFVYFMCLNEEDGLEFKVLQQNDGYQSCLQVFWQNLDVTDKTDDFKLLIADHPLLKVFELRVVTILHQQVEQQIKRLNHGDEIIEQLKTGNLFPRHKMYATQLRESERYILEQSLESLIKQKNNLLENYTVKEYLSPMATSTQELDISDDESDFS